MIATQRPVITDKGSLQNPVSVDRHDKTASTDPLEQDCDNDRSELYETRLIAFDLPSNPETMKYNLWT